MERKRRFFKDRSDGRCLKTNDPVFRVIPYIMRNRDDSQIFFDETLDITYTDEFIKQNRETQKSLKFLSVVVAAYVRTVSQVPYINRFVSGGKIFSRNKITVAFVIKKKLSFDGVEAIIKLDFDPFETLFEIDKKIADAIAENKKPEAENDTDIFVNILNKLPGLVLSMFIRFANRLDYMGILPKSLINLSPFHTGLFITDLGSIGIEPVFHHLYNFGNTTAFISFGIKGQSGDKKTIGLKAVVDERICDGFTYAIAFKKFFKYIQDPSLLMETPEHIKEDEYAL